MASEMKFDNSGAIFVNDRKETEKHPDRTGSITVEGKEYWLNGWLKKDKNGKPFLSLSVKAKTAAKAAAAPPKEQKVSFDDEIPF
jgi:hypothetical protein